LQLFFQLLLLPLSLFLPVLVDEDLLARVPVRHGGGSCEVATEFVVFAAGLYCLLGQGRRGHLLWARWYQPLKNMPMLIRKAAPVTAMYRSLRSAKRATTNIKAVNGVVIMPTRRHFQPSRRFDVR